MTTRQKGNGERWWHKRSNVVIAVGVGIILASFLNSEIFLRPFHYEYVTAGLALVGAGLAVKVDKT